MTSASSPARKVLVVGPSWVGDMVMAQSLFKALKLRGDCDIDVLAPGWSLPILERMPEVREAFSSGRIGRCQVERVAKAHANPRIRAGVSGTIRAPSSS